MSNVIKATLNLRGEKYPGVILDVDGFQYLRLVMNDQEVSLLDNRQYIEAIDCFEKRILGHQATLEGTNPEDKQKYLRDLAQFILGRVEDDYKSRVKVVMRLKERFPTLPDELVYWEPKTETARLNLDMIESVQVIMGILTPALQIVREKRVEDIQPAVELEPQWQEKMSQLETENKAPVGVSIDLDEEEVDF